MAKRSWTSAELRAKIDAYAEAGVFNFRAVQTILRRREAGLTRQRTTAEIVPCIHGVWCPDTRCSQCNAMPAGAWTPDLFNGVGIERSEGADKSRRAGAGPSRDERHRLTGPVRLRCHIERRV